MGKSLSALRARVEGGLEERRAEIDAVVTAGAAEALDLTLPGLAARRGARHLITQTMEEICDIFMKKAGMEEPAAS